MEESVQGGMISSFLGIAWNGEHKRSQSFGKEGKL